MIYSDTFSTLVENHHSQEEIADIDQAVASWINNGGRFGTSDHHAELYEKLVIPTEGLNQAEVIQKLTAFRQFLRALPVFEIAIAFQPDDIFKSTLISRIKQMVNGDFVVRIVVKPTLIAGCTIDFKGKFGDYSLLKIFKDNREKIFGEAIRELR